ncbi:MAG: DUF1449 family protein [Deltaproteobacteria bacterium]|nr:DUF1449 family protein [Deltaproteobacteria bacterium]MBN2672798.1 DUF1449 family protein [Deltaproteobacteria bacterium]
MTEFLHFLAFCVSPANILYTGLFALAMMYWLTVIIGVFDLDLFDFDLDVDMDVDVDADVDADADTGTSTVGVFHSLLMFFNFGQVPVMIIFTFLALIMWSASLLGQYYIFQNSVFWGLVLFIPNFMGSMIVTKFVTQPFKGLFNKLAEEKEDYEEMIGRNCVVTTSKVDEEFGQAQIETGGSPLVITARTENGEILYKDEEAIVINYDIKTSIAIIHRA